jgi:hypothetical protein
MDWRLMSACACSGVEVLEEAIVEVLEEVLEEDIVARPPSILLGQAYSFLATNGGII